MQKPDAKIVEKLKGKFIVFDGPDGCGKSTQCRLLAERLTEAGLEVVTCRDPGGTVIGDRIRAEVLGPDLSSMDVRCETFLFMASRAQLVGEVIESALRDRKVVVCDRFVSSTCAYQGAAGYDVRKVIELASYAIGETWPDVTIVLDVDVNVAFQRIKKGPHHVGMHPHRQKHKEQGTLFGDLDGMDARPKSFHRRVREIMLTLPEIYPRPVRIIPAEDDAERIHAKIWDLLNDVDF